MSSRVTSAVSGVVLAAALVVLPQVSKGDTDWTQCRVESGQAVITAGNTIAAIPLQQPVADVAKAFVLVDESGGPDVQNAADYMAMATLADPATVVVERAGTSGDVQLGYSVVECFQDEFTVQRGVIDVAASDTVSTAAITPADVNGGLVLIDVLSNQFTPDATTGLFTGALDGAGAEVQVQRDHGGTEAAVSYQVVEFTSEAIADGLRVHTGEVVLVPGEAEQLVSLPQHEPGRSWAYCSWDAADNGLQQTAIGCQLTTGTELAVHRFDAGAYTNQVRYHVVEFPPGAVYVQRGVIEHDPSGVDGQRYDIEYPVTDIGQVTSAFNYTTSTTAGTLIAFPRQQWVHTIINTTVLQSSFWRPDISDNDRTRLYYQLVKFATFYGANGWGWLGSAPAPGSPQSGPVYGPISFGCENLAGTSGTPCQFDYGVDFEHGGCGAECDVSGQAWVGITDSTGGAVLGMIEFDPQIDLSNISSYPVAVGDDPTTVEYELQDAHWNEESRELYGWARLYTLAQYEQNTLGIADDTWGWIKLRGTVNDGTDSEYVVRVSADDELIGWGWNDDGVDTNGAKAAGTGLGWVKFDLNISEVTTNQYFSTTQGDIYAGGEISQPQSGAADGFYGATYRIEANGDITNVESQLAVEDPDLPQNYFSDTNAEELQLPIDNGHVVYRGDLGTIRVGDLVQQAEVDITGPVDADGYSCTSDIINAYANPLGNRVFYCDGDMRVSTNITFFNGVGEGLGAGTIVVNGDLFIEDNINYFNNTLSNQVNNLASVGWIVLGDVIVDSSVTEMMGAYVVLGDSAAIGGEISTGIGSLPLTVQGMVAAGRFNLERTAIGANTNPFPSELFSYDGRLLANPPPGFENFTAVLPQY